MAVVLALVLAALADDAPAVPPATLPTHSATPLPTPRPGPHDAALLVAGVGMSGTYVGGTMVLLGLPLAFFAAFMCTDACSEQGAAFRHATDAVLGGGLVLLAAGPAVAGVAELAAQDSLGGAPTLPVVALVMGVASLGSVALVLGDGAENPQLVLLTGLAAATTGYVAGGVELGRLTARAEARRASIGLAASPGGVVVSGRF